MRIVRPQNQRLCSLEEAIAGEGGAAVWRLAQTKTVGKC